MSMPDYNAQMESFKRSDEAREEMLRDILERYEILLQERTILKQDYAMEQSMRRSLQGRVEHLESDLKGVDNNSFVLALIDGDGYVFQDMLLQAAADGGSEAASKLQQAIREHVVSLYSDSNSAASWPIVTHIYLSLDKFAQTLVKAGILKLQQDFRAFAQAFSVNQPLFSIIDVGFGKERADYRLKEMLRTFSGNPTCKHIVFGGCHDNGYLLDLDQYKHNEARASRITLLQTAATQPGFRSLPNFKKAQFDAVFRPQPLPDVSYYAQPPPLAHTQPLGHFQTQRSVPLRTKTTSPVAIQPAPYGHPSPGSTAPSLADSAETPPDASWATVGKQGGINGTYSIAPTPSKKKRYIYYNKAGQRLDENLPPRDKAATQAIEKRMNDVGKNLCNNYHLNRGRCDNGAFCHFQHEPRLTPAETNALRYKTRSLACKHRDCESFDCYLGHQCGVERETGRCTYATCNLRATHGMDQTKYERWDEDNNVEYAPS
ncbi:hypothetical protein K491DRAFT_688013 [Lophiostoma macrostomum CBS 122681]|uniref:C3H1-type domain-containing protein n=1 Tax=Lophiostoma macrostomum CBS 122681 TaxID=1314788 RepID=A0A6A6TPL5_9PLEO|nr:hypothetical protein K491DRAFT_688013 [Lophiostoma macrostomum CBS 122681]